MSGDRLRVLVGCEFSGIVRDAFRAVGCDAVSCDLLPSERPGPHIQGDIRDHLRDRWDLAVFHPPCRFLAASGARWWKGREREQEDALAFFKELLNAPIPKVAVENPVGKASSVRKADQIVQPWQFGIAETKATCLWLVNLPPLRPTKIAMQTTLEQKNIGRVHHVPPSVPDRWKERSRTYQGIADAMADQWGKLLLATPPHRSDS